MSPSIKSAHLTLTPHHLFYLLSRIDELSIPVGPMNVRIESIHSEPSQNNYVSFLQKHQAPQRGRSDGDSIHSVSSLRSVMSGMSSFWSSIGIGSSQSRVEKARAVTEGDLKYLYSAFTKLPSLRFTTDPRAKLIQGYEEFPFDTAVPLFVFKNVQQLDIVDMDFRQFHGWDRLADQLCLLTIKRGNLDDPTDLLTNIVLDDAERRRRRSTRTTSETPSTPLWSVPTTPSTPHNGYATSTSDPGSPGEYTPGNSPRADGQQQLERQGSVSDRQKAPMTSTAGTVSPRRLTSGRSTSTYRHSRTNSAKIKRSGSGSSNSSDYAPTPRRSDSSTNITYDSALPASKWQRLKYLSLADNALTSISAASIAPVATSLRSLNLSSNLFVEIPDSLSTLTRLTSLDLSNCMIESLQSLSRCPLPAITTIKLKSNRLRSLAGVERLLSLENLHVQDNNLSDPSEAARLTGIPNIQRIWVKYNPMTKVNDYRVRIMNLFRQTPGYVEDILIDDSPATYAEKKLLVPRAPEIERLPVTVTSRPLASPVIIQHSTATSVKSQSKQDFVTAITQHEVSNPSARRRRGPRRRIVDLSARDSGSLSPNMMGIDDSTVVDDLTGTTGIQQIDELAKAETTPALSDASELDLDPPDLTESVAVQQDRQDAEYRDKVEALRQQFGANWLNALSEQHWHADHHFATEAEQSHTKLHLMGSPLVTTGGRTLG